MTTVKVAILGFGTVGQGIYHIVNEKRKQFNDTLGVDIEIVKILVNNLNKSRSHAPKELFTDKFEDILAIPDLDVVFEAIVGEEPAFRYLSKIIEKGSNIITANKVMFSKHGLALQEKAWYDFCFLLKSSISTAQLPEQGGKPKHNALGF